MTQGIQIKAVHDNLIDRSRRHHQVYRRTYGCYIASSHCSRVICACIRVLCAVRNRLEFSFTFRKYKQNAPQRLHIVKST